MNKLFLVFAISLSLHSKAQNEVIDGRVVLLTDSINLFGKKYISTEFSHGYTIVELFFSVPFPESSYITFQQKTAKYDAAIRPFKSSDNKQFVCIFPKQSLKWVHSASEFLNNNFPDLDKQVLLNKKTKQVQVVKNYEINNTKEEKGFN
jgi:hypothetical protein